MWLFIKVLLVWVATGKDTDILDEELLMEKALKFMFKQ